MTEDTKKAETNYDILEVIKNRWSPRSFDEREVSKEQVLKLLDAARWAASSFNEQPWRFFVGFKGDETYQKIYDSLVEFNQGWVNAPVLILAVGKKTFSKTGDDNKHHAYDTGQAMAHLALQATNDGLHVHQMAGFSKEVVIQSFGIPEGFQPLTACAVGYKGDPDQLEESNRKSELAKRTRKPISEIAFVNKWEESLD